MRRPERDERRDIPEEWTAFRLEIQCVTWYKYLWNAEPREVAKARTQLTKKIMQSPEEEFPLKMREALAKYGNSMIQMKVVELLQKRKADQPAPKPSSVEETQAKMVNEAKASFMDAERYFTEEKKEELQWMRGKLEEIFQIRERSLMEKFLMIYKEVSRSRETTVEVQKLAREVGGQIKYADHIAEMTKLLPDLHIKSVEEVRQETKEEPQALCDVHQEYQAICEVPYLPIQELNYLPKMSDESRLLNAQLFDKLLSENVVNRSPCGLGSGNNSDRTRHRIRSEWQDRPSRMLKGIDGRITHDLSAKAEARREQMVGRLKKSESGGEGWWFLQG
jgi:hypothetical protein